MQTEIEQAETSAAKSEAGAWPEAQASMEADVDPEALTVVAKADVKLTAAHNAT